MNKKIGVLLLAIPILMVACVSRRSEVATKFGYEKSSKVQNGPYELHYGQHGSDEFLLLNEGNWNIISRYDGEGTDVYLDGRPFIHFERNSDGSLTNLYMDIPDRNGKTKITLIDGDVDGQWDIKIDHILGKKYIWKDDRWVER